MQEEFSFRIYLDWLIYMIDETIRYVIPNWIDKDKKNMIFFCWQEMLSLHFFYTECVYMLKCHLLALPKYSSEQ